MALVGIARDKSTVCARCAPCYRMPASICLPHPAFVLQSRWRVTASSMATRTWPPASRVAWQLSARAWLSESLVTPVSGACKQVFLSAGAFGSVHQHAPRSGAGSAICTLRRPQLVVHDTVLMWTRLTLAPALLKRMRNWATGPARAALTVAGCVFSTSP